MIRGKPPEFFTFNGYDNFDTDKLRELKINLFQYYAYYFCCSNCNHNEDVWIKKGLAKEIVNELECPKCGCVTTYIPKIKL